MDLETSNDSDFINAPMNDITTTTTTTALVNTGTTPKVVVVPTRNVFLKSSFVPQPMSTDAHDEEDFQEMLRAYYDLFFPYKKFYKWLSYGEVQKHYFEHREFSFTKDEIYSRYRSFASCNEFERVLKEACPSKIDIGAVFNAKPKDHKSYILELKAIEKELVFDIDMTDYDEVRTCCDGARICEKCWPFLTLAIKILDRSLREDFGFQHLLWVYSGRRGIHCWVCDFHVRKYDSTVRSAIVDYLTVIRGGQNQSKRVTITTPIHAFIQTSWEIINAHFQSLVLVNQDILSHEAHREKVLSMIPDEEIQKSLRDSWSMKSRTSVERWKELSEVVSLSSKRNLKLRTVLYEIMYYYTYPRLDTNVSKGVNHLLKSPFSIHPSTARVCVPIDVDTVDEFDPTQVPTITDLYAQYSSYNNTHPADPSEKPLRAYKKTGLKEYIDVFRKFLAGLEVAIKEERDKNKTESAKGGLW